MLGFKLVTETEYNELIENRDYWRELAEKERRRADSFQEKVLQLNGLPPMIQEEGESIETHPASVRKHLEMMMEFLNEEAANDPLDVEPEPEETPAAMVVKE